MVNTIDDTGPKSNIGNEYTQPINTTPTIPSMPNVIDPDVHFKPKELAGRKDDSGKLRMDLIPSEALFALADILTSGAKKYEDRNWEKGMKWGRVYGALMRHMWAWWAGKKATRSFLFDDEDEETHRSHLWHALCCIVFLVVYEERKIGEDDRAS